MVVTMCIIRDKLSVSENGRCHQWKSHRARAVDRPVRQGGGPRAPKQQAERREKQDLDAARERITDLESERDAHLQALHAYFVASAPRSRSEVSFQQVDLVLSSSSMTHETHQKTNLAPRNRCHTGEPRQPRDHADVGVFCVCRGNALSKNRRRADPDLRGSRRRQPASPWTQAPPAGRSRFPRMRSWSSPHRSHRP